MILLPELPSFSSKGGKSAETAAKTDSQQKPFLFCQALAELPAEQIADDQAGQSISCQRGPGESQLKGLQ